MIDVAVSEGVVEAVDVEKNEVAIRVDGWQPATDGPRLDRRVDTTIAGRTTGLHFPDAAVAVESAADDRWTIFDAHAGPLALPDGRHVVQIETAVPVYVALAAPGELSRRAGDGAFSIRLARPSAVTVGFRSRVDRPRHTIAVPETLPGALRAVRYLSAAIDTDAPDKSYPTQRAHPPRIDFGPAVDVPEPVSRAAAVTDITVSVPRALEPLLVTAPLVYYLQADVEFAAGSAVTVDAPDLIEPVRLGVSSPLEADVSDLLQRVFYLDCLVRNAGPYDVALREQSLLEGLAVDAAELYAQSGGERLASYLRADFPAIADGLPDWHLSVVVEPRLANVRALPYLLDRLSLVQVPAPVAVAKQTAAAESVPLSYAGRSSGDDRGHGQRVVRNASRLGVFQGWLAPGRPIDAFRVTRAAFEHRFRFHQHADGPRTVVVVINDEDMLEERAVVEEIYGARAAELAIEVTVEEAPSREGLADILASPADFLHYIGHCDPAGLRCPDGSLSVTAVDRTDVQTFFLNACGSFDQGLELVRRGSVAGAVTLHDVLNPEATRVGVAFARLVMHGFSVNHALALAGRRSLSNKFYTVVGDGTHRLSQGEDTFPSDLAAERVGDDRFRLEFNFPQSSVPGGLAVPTLPDESEYVLRGASYTSVLDESRFVEFLTNVSVPVVYGDELYWSTALADRLRPEHPSELPI